MPSGVYAHDPLLQSMNGRRPRISGHGEYNPGSYAVAPDPVISDGFSWERVKACQCIAWFPYTMPSQSDENIYFTELVRQAIISAEQAVAAPTSDLLSAMAALCTDAGSGPGNDLTNDLEIKAIRYGQLEERRDPPPRTPPVADDYVPACKFESWSFTESRQEKPPPTKPKVVVKNYVQAPLAEGGRVYELTNVRGWPFTLRITCLVNLSTDDFDLDRNGDEADGTVNYAVELRCVYRSKDHVYEQGQGVREQCVRLAIGEVMLGTGEFSAWDLALGDKQLPCVMVGNQELKEKFFSQSKWPMVVTDTRGHDGTRYDEAGSGGGGDGGGDGSGLFGAPTSRLKYNFDVIDDHQCVQQTRSKGNESEFEWTRIANFYLIGRPATYAFVDGSHAPYDMLLVRTLLNPNGTETMVLTTEDTNRTPCLDNVCYLDVEVLVDVTQIKSSADVRGLFKKWHSSLDAIAMPLDMFGSWMALFNTPIPQSVIVRFGRQKGSNLFVAGNMAYGEGQIGTLKEANVHIVPSFFEQSLQPMMRADYPLHIVIPYVHVRFYIATKLYQLMPMFFKNNMWAARSLLCAAVMGMQSSKLWAGQTGFGHMAPVVWAWSPEYGTGKTEVGMTANALCGGYKRGLWAAESSKAAFMERLSQMADLVLVADDMVANAAGESRLMATLIRCIADHTCRAVQSKQRFAEATAIITVCLACPCHGVA